MFLGIHLTGNLTPFELLSQVQRLLREREYSDYLPCRWLAEATALHSNLDRSALFQILFDANIAEPSDSGRGFQLDTPMEYLKNLPKVPELNWHIRSDGTRLVARLAYNARLFTAATIERFCGHLENLLRAVAANPDVPVGRLAMISPEERSQLIADARCSQRVYPTRPGIQLLFEDQVKQNPSSTALVFRDLRLSYQELNRRANRLAHCLQSRGVKRGTQVAILMERSADTVIAILAILKASGTYVPLDASYPRTRVSFILADAAIRVLITHRALVAALPDHKVELVVLEENQETTTTEDECNLACETEGSDTALVLYTSGSTGNPKGVLVRHDSLINLYHAYAEVYDYSAGAPSVCQTAFFSFAVFQADWIRALCSGGKLALCTPEVLLSPLRLYRFMREEEVDFAEFVPSLLRSLINYLQQSGKRLDCMHTIVVGSDRWYLREYHETQRYCGSNTHLIHVYGASETTFDSTWFNGTEVDPAGDQLAPIGKPFGSDNLGNAG